MCICGSGSLQSGRYYFFDVGFIFLKKLFQQIKSQISCKIQREMGGKSGWTRLAVRYLAFAKSMLLYRANNHNLPVKEHKNED